MELSEHCDYLKHLYARVWGGADKWRKLKMYKFHNNAFKRYDDRQHAAPRSKWTTAASGSRALSKLRSNVGRAADEGKHKNTKFGFGASEERDTGSHFNNAEGSQQKWSLHIRLETAG